MINTNEKVSILEGIRSINYRAILLCVLSFFISRICVFDGYYCVGAAYIGTMYFSKETRRWSVLFGILGLLSLGTISFDIMKYAVVFIMITLMRYGITFLGYECHIKNQVVITGVSMLLIGIMGCQFEGMSIYKLIVCLLEVASTIGIMSILSLAVKVIYKKKETKLNEYELASIAFLLACFICGIIDFYVAVPWCGKIYFRDVLIFVVLIGSIYLGGMGNGTVISIIVSSILVIIGYIPASFVTIYVFTALIGGLFFQMERIGIIFAMTLGLLLSFALFNDRVIDPTIMGAYVIGSIISLIIPKNYFGIAAWYDRENVNAIDHHMHDMQGIITGRLKKFSSAFGSLGKQFQNIPYAHMNLEVKQMNELIEETGETLCKDCPMRNFCWRDYIQDTYKSCYQIIRTIDKQGKIKEGDIPEQFKKACIHAESFAYTMGMVLDVYKNDCKWHETFNEARKMVGNQFKGVSESISALIDQVEKDLTFDEELENKIRNELLMVGVKTRDVMVLKVEGKSQEVHIYCNYKGEADYKERVRSSIEKALGMQLEIKKYEYFLEEAYCYFEFSAKKLFHVASSVQYSAKEDVSGDVYSYLEIGEGNYLMALADGMGSGRLAQKESQMTIELLEKFIEAGFGCEVVIRLVNSALVLKSDIECSSTIDAIMIDQYTGIASFYKAGASSSFILRDGEVLTIKASSLPVGILSEVDLVSFKRQLKDGDIIIMVTDGMLEDLHAVSDRETTFKHFIIEANSSSPEYLAKYLMEKTKNLLAGSQNDDMTILVSRVWEVD